MTPAIEELRLGDPVPYRIREEQRRAVREFVRELNSYAKAHGWLNVAYSEEPSDAEVLDWMASLGLAKIQAINIENANAAKRGEGGKAA